MYAKIDSHMRNAVFELPRETRNLATECDFLDRTKPVFDVKLYSATMDKLVKRFVEGSKAEALDEEGVWCVCTVVCSESEAISVAFDGWGEEWNRTIDDPREIRELSVIPESSGRRKATNLSRKVRSNSELCLILMYSSLLDLLRSYTADHSLKAVSQAK